MSLSTRSSNFEVGSRVIGAGRKGVVSFIGDTQFSTGEWIGIVLETADGKNDGSVGGVCYFECQPLHGVFLKRVSLSILFSFYIC